MDKYDQEAAQARWTAAAENQARLEWAFVQENELYRRLDAASSQAVREHGIKSEEAREANGAASAQAKRCLAVSNQRQEAREEFVAASLWLHGIDSHRA